MNEQLQLETPRVASAHHHPAFRNFVCWEGRVPEGYIVNFLGVLTRTDNWKGHVAIEIGYPKVRYVRTEYPPFDEDYFEWIDLLEALTAAEGRFTMVELGAGWGRWIVNAAAALNRLGNLPHTLIGVEAEPTHFQMMVQHVAANGLDSKNFQLIEAAVTRSDGKVGFLVGETEQGDPRTHYGQHIGGPHTVDAISLRSLLELFPVVDLIDLDVQGAGFEVLEAAAEALDRKVKRIHIGTHGRNIEAALRSLFGRLGWRCRNLFPCHSSVDTEWGPISFQDGVQTWLNPTFSSSATEAGVLQEKLELCRQECARLWAELEKKREEGSRGWKILAKGSRPRAWIKNKKGDGHGPGVK